jgi:hypothetical protein
MTLISRGDNVHRFMTYKGWNLLSRHYKLLNRCNIGKSINLATDKICGHQCIIQQCMKMEIKIIFWTVKIYSYIIKFLKNTTTWIHFFKCSCLKSCCSLTLNYIYSAKILTTVLTVRWTYNAISNMKI